MAKGKKTGGTPQLGETPRDKLIRVSSDVKPDDDFDAVMTKRRKNENYSDIHRYLN